MLSGKSGRHLHGTGVKIAKRQINAVKYFVMCAALKMFTTLRENGKMSFCGVTAAVGCRKPLSATDKQKTTSPEWIRILPVVDL